MVLPFPYVQLCMYVRYTTWSYTRSSMVNGLRGVHIASNIPVDIPLNSKEMQLAMANVHENECWEMLNASVVSRGEMNIIGDIEIDFIVIGGVERVFH